MYLVLIPGFWYEFVWLCYEFDMNLVWIFGTGVHMVWIFGINFGTGMNLVWLWHEFLYGFGINFIWILGIGMHLNMTLELISYDFGMTMV